WVLRVLGPLHSDRRGAVRDRRKAAPRGVQWDRQPRGGRRMLRSPRSLLRCALALTVLSCATANAQEGPAPPTVDLIIESGRPLRIALDARVHVTRVGQPITGKLIDPRYAYDRIVVPSGTVVGG